MIDSDLEIGRSILGTILFYFNFPSQHLSSFEPHCSTSKFQTGDFFAGPWSFLGFIHSHLVLNMLDTAVWDLGIRGIHMISLPTSLKLLLYWVPNTLFPGSQLELVRLHPDPGFGVECGAGEEIILHPRSF